MGLGSRLGTCVGGMAVAGGLLASPAGAGTRANLTVSPSTGLQDGQVVSLTITGATSELIRVEECTNPIVNWWTGCGYVKHTQTSWTGVVTTPMTVRRSFESWSGGTVDCSAPQACAVAIFVGETFTDPGWFGDSVPITFAQPK